MFNWVLEVPLTRLPETKGHTDRINFIGPRSLVQQFMKI